MKNYRALVPIVMIVIMVCSWYMLVSEAVEQNQMYETYLGQARSFADKEITSKAVENYNLALDIKSTPEIYAEVADYYYSIGDNSKYLDWCEDFFAAYPTDSTAYDCILKAYLDGADYASCYDVLSTAEKRSVSSDYMNEVSESIAYKYKFDYSTYTDVGVYNNGMCCVKDENEWGYVDMFGQLRIPCKFTSVSAYSQSNFASVVDSEGEAYFADSSGGKILVADEEYRRYGMYVTDMTAAQKTDGKYVYLDENLNLLYEEYDYASTVNNGIAVVKNGDKWSIINSEGKMVCEDTFSDIKLDEKEIAYRNDRLFVKKGKGKYIMIDSSGKQIGSLEFDDAKPFSDETYAAVKIDGKWSFINKDGNLISDKTYDDARSFRNGLAAVCVSGKWGFVDESEEMKIEAQFNGAMDFNEKGSCFVNVGDKWQLLKLYRLNRED